MSKLKDEYTCSLQLAVDLIGGKWKLMILFYLIDDTKRFGELQNDIPDITQKMLTQHLRELEDSNLIKRKVYPVVPPKVEYSLTEHGISLIPLIKSMCDWSISYANDNNINLK